MELEEARSRLRPLMNFYSALGALDAILETASSVDNIKALAAERMAAAERAQHAMETAQSELTTYELAAAKKRAEIDKGIADLEAEHKRRIGDLEAEFEAHKRKTEQEVKNLQASYGKTAEGLSKEIQALTAKRDDIQAQVDKAETSLAALKQKFSHLV